MKHITKPIFVSVLVMTMSAVAYGQAAGGAGATPTSGMRGGSMNSQNEAGYGSPGTTGTGAGAGKVGGAARISPMTTHSNGAKTNGLNKGTNSGANSDVNARPGGAARNGQ
jgi:hypothetical protein